MTTNGNGMADKQEWGPGSIAIVGMAGRFPAAATTGELWRMLRDGREATRWFTDEELLAAGVSGAALKDPNYVKAGMVLPDMEAFDADFFGFSPREAAILDPQHRHFLECAFEALEDAGHMPETFPGAIGVFAGCGMQAYMAYNLLTNPELLESVGLFLLRHTGNDKDFLTTRASYLLNLQGPSISVQTACSTSLVAVHLAAQSLLSGECDMALAGGATIELPHRQGYRYAEGEILSPDGHCRAFDDASKGTIFGSGAGIVALRRLEDAVADRDNIYAVIRGSAVNNDGSQKAGYLAPSVEGQARAAAEALAVAGIDPTSVAYIEAHGTGTPVGDPIELAALTQAYGASGARQFCRIGSLKTNIGHLDTAAGVASLIKVSLALRHGEVPASLNFDTPNSRFDFAASPFEVARARTPWPRGATPRRAAVNSLGVGGTNAHVIVEEAPPAPATQATRDWQVLALSARNAERLEALKRKWVDFLSPPPTGFCIADAAFTTQNGRRAFAHRCAVVARDGETLRETLESRTHRRLAAGKGPAVEPGVVFMFPGGGAQYPGMGRELYDTVPAFRDAVDECFALMPADAPADLRAIMLGRASDDAEAGGILEQPTYTIPALFVAEYATARMWESWGVKPAALIGHSAGEYAAACIAGVMSVADALSVVVLRGQIFEAIPAGAMLAVTLSETALRARIGTELDIAAANAPELSVATGTIEAIERLETALAADAIECKRLRINVAAHSRMLDAELGRFRDRLRRVALSPPRIPFVSNLSGAFVDAGTLVDPEYWVKHLRQTVRYAAGLQALLAEPNRILLEAGPGQSLGALARLNAGASSAGADSDPTSGQALRPVSTPPLAVLPSMRQAQEVDSDLAFALTSAGRMWAFGLPLDWQALRGDGTARRISLPTYAFEKRRHWIEPGRLRAAAQAEDAGERGPAEAGAIARIEAIDDWFSLPQWVPTPLAPATPDRDGRWLVFADDSPVSAALLDRLAGRGLTPLIVRTGAAFSRQNSTFTLNPARPEDYRDLFAALDGDGWIPDRIAHLWSLAAPSPVVGAQAAGEDQVPGFDSVLATCQALQHLGLDGDIRIAVVTAGSQSVEGEPVGHPERATLLGPCRVAPREMPNLTMQVVDLDANGDDLTDRAEQVLAEFDARSSDDLVALRGRSRWTQRLTPAPMARPDGLPARLRKNGVYLVTGGLGAIGLALAEYLASTVQARLVLVSRGALPPRSQWTGIADGTTPSPQVATIRRLTAIEARGAELLLLNADVADAAAMERAVGSARDRFGTIHGVFHAAGVMDDGALLAKTPESIRRVLAPKLYGGQVLDALFPRGSLDVFALFSSTSALLGPAGQVDYVAANAFLDALATARPDGLAIDWGIWSDIGMAVKAYAGPQAGADAMPDTSGGHPLIGAEIRRDETGAMFEALYDPARMWVLAEHLVAGRPVLPGAAYVEMARAACAAVSATPDADVQGLSIAAPLAFEPGESRRVRTTLARLPGGHFEFRVESRGTASAEWVEHAQATLAPDDPAPMPAERYAAMAAQSDGARAVPGLGFPQTGAVVFGPRWHNIRWIELNGQEAIGEFELPATFASDCETIVAHPALLDMAATFGLHLVKGAATPDSDTVYVPVSVTRMKIRNGRWPERIRSHARLAAAREGTFATFDVVLADLAGQPLATFEGFTLSCVPRAAMQRPSGARPRSQGVHALLQAGIRAADAPDLFARILSGQHRRIVASSIAIPDLRQAMAANARPKVVRVERREGSAPQGYANEVESRIAGYWSELLGVANVAPDDDFFDLGGFSLVAVRLFAKIRKQYAVDLPLATLFQTPTLRQLSALVAEMAGIAPSEPSEPSTQADVKPPMARIVPLNPRVWSPLVPICRGMPNRPPLFCVHGGGGNVLNFSDISRKLGRDQPFYGLQAQGVDGALPPLQTVEEMASTYIAAIRTVDATGPYCLAGYSGGGVVAFEMAQQLVRAGCPVSLLVMFDTLNSRAAGRRISLVQRLWAARHWSLRFALAWPRRAWGHRAHLQALAEMRRHIGPDRRVPHEHLGLYLMEIYLEAQRTYEAEPYPGSLVLFRAREASIEYVHAGAALGWKDLIQGGVEVHQAMANHETLMLEPAVDTVASILRGKLDAVVTPASLKSA